MSCENKINDDLLAIYVCFEHNEIISQKTPCHIILLNNICVYTYYTNEWEKLSNAL